MNDLGGEHQLSTLERIAVDNVAMLDAMTKDAAARWLNGEQVDRSRSELYLDLLPQIMSRQVQLLDNDRLITQLVSLERRTSRGGRDIVDHPPGGHDDIANAAAGAILSMGFMDRHMAKPAEVEAWPANRPMMSQQAIDYMRRVEANEPVSSSKIRI
ncbi:hypothetical protein [Bradyrhizobium cenepequi]|uniref:hypothetical protein n=1 Tax=Bradyrhizobium cenepequi TaxID=2821403 RepID=UPI001CE32A1F|nr:hypothetical protein [Bradyrhizobium cenepequi]MCA6112484.1 hypothetical protein [Bradyrhizobium cenepequi]